MREIKFRAKPLVAGDHENPPQWVYGHYHYSELLKEHLITAFPPLEDVETVWKIDPDTLRQFIGILDKNDVDIYDGDIFRVFDWGEGDGQILGNTSVVWDTDANGWRYSNYNLVESHYYEFRIVEVIGNTDDNPELLEKL